MNIGQNTFSTSNQAIGMTVAQQLFARGMTRAELGHALGVTGQAVSSRLHGKANWTADDLLATAELFKFR